jgi:hypothetical protein
MEVTLTPFQASIFNLVIARFNTLGVNGNSVFSDTYVLQKAVIDYISNNTITSGNQTTAATQVYNGVLNIVPPTPPTTTNQQAPPPTTTNQQAPPPTDTASQSAGPTSAGPTTSQTSTTSTTQPANTGGPQNNKTQNN